MFQDRRWAYLSMAKRGRCVKTRGSCGGFGDSESEMGFFEEAAEIGKGKSKAKTGFALEGNIDEMGILGAWSQGQNGTLSIWVAKGSRQ